MYQLIIFAFCDIYKCDVLWTTTVNRFEGRNFVMTTTYLQSRLVTTITALNNVIYFAIYSYFYINISTNIRNWNASMFVAQNYCWLIFTINCLRGFKQK